MSIKKITTAYLLFCSVYCFAQSNKMIAVYAHTGNMFIHTQAVKNVEGAKPYGFSIDIGKQFTDDVIYQISKGYPRKGLNFSYFNFNTPILGNGYILSHYLQPVYRIGKNFQLHFKGNIGVAYLDNPNDAIKNPTNQSYSQHINPYMQLSIGAGVKISKHIIAEINTGFHHISNGNFTMPNKGINWTASNIAFQYYPQQNSLPKHTINKQLKFIDKAIKFDVGLFYSPKQDYNPKWQAQRSQAYGIILQGSKQVGKTNAITVATELYYNDIQPSTASAFKNTTAAWQMGALIGHEFLLGKVIFSQQVGFYTLPHPSYYSNYYHRWGLRYKLTNNIWAGINLKAHADDADFVDFRILCRLKK